MENIFGHFSDDSDDVAKAPSSSSHPAHPPKLQVSLVYSSDSDVPVKNLPVAVKQEKSETTSPLPAGTAEKRKKKSKESRSRDRKKSGSDKDPSNHKTRSSENHSETEDLLEAGRALESKLLEESSVATFTSGPAKEPETKTQPPSSGISEHKKKKKKSKKAHRDPSPTSFKTETVTETPVVPIPSSVTTAAVTIKTEPIEPEASAPAVSALLPSPKSKTAAKSTEETQLSMPSLWETGSVGGTPSTTIPTITAVSAVSAVPTVPTIPATPATPATPAVPTISTAASIPTIPDAPDAPSASDVTAADEKARPVIWKHDTEDAVAGLLLETFDDFKTETLDEESVEPVAVPAEEMVPNEEALKAIQSLQCEDDLDLSGEMIIDSEAGTSSEAEVTPYSVPEATAKNGSSSKALPETAPTPPPSPPELLIDETRCHPDNESTGSVKEEKPPKTPEINMKSPRTPDLEMDVSRGPPTPELSAVTPSLANPVTNPTVAALKQSQQHKNAEAKSSAEAKNPGDENSFIQSPPKRGRKSTGSYSIDFYFIVCLLVRFLRTELM